MAPIRRYLRITKYSVLEVRIYLDNPTLGAAWLLNPRAPVLPRVIEAVRPLVLPKLREENERHKGKGKKKNVKDIVVEDDFEVAMFLTETNTRHSLLTKQKHFKEKKEIMQSNSSKLTGTNETPIDVEDVAIREESDEEMGLTEIPPPSSDSQLETDTRRSARIRALEDIPPSSYDAFGTDVRQSKRGRANSTDGLFVESEDDDDDEPPSKKARQIEDEEEDDDKKKMSMDTIYDGFSIYGRVLCLVVKKRDVRVKIPGHAMMENWITSTQMPIEDF